MTLIDKAEAHDDLIRRGDVVEAVTQTAVRWGVTGEPAILIATKAAIAVLPARGVGVKPLVWLAKSEWHHVAENPFGECWIKHYNGRGGLWTLYGPGHYGPNNNFPTLEAAKAAAQADYEARILAALAPTE